MELVRIRSKGQDRWNRYGKRRLNDVKRHPEDFIINKSPIRPIQLHHDIMRTLGSPRGKNVLELGSGRGEFAVYMAKQGAKVTAVDVSPDLISASRELAGLNKVRCEFQQADIRELPFDSGSYDIVVGIAVLHHLSA